jgi:hypothetical protein
MLDWEVFLETTEQAIRTAWPDLFDNGLYEFDQAVRGSWERKAFPFIVHDLPAAGGAAEWGLANITFDPYFTVHLIARTMTQAELRQRLMALARRMLDADFTGTGATLLHITDVNWSGTHPAMAVFHSKNVPFRGGSITFQFVVGVTAY